MTETWEPRPLPEMTPETERFWAAAAEGRLLLSRCPDCALDIFYPRARCPDCFGETTWTEAAGTGTVYTYTITSHVADWPEDDLPVVNAYVELDEGPRVMTNVVDVDPKAVAVGMDVAVEFVPTDVADVAVPVFAPV
jgi:uncharacterized OB-fold protein